MKKRFEKLKDKLDVTKFKDKIDNLGIFKSKLDKLKEKLDDLDDEEKETLISNEKPLKEDSIRQKYKSINLLGKTKQILKEYEALDDSYLAPGDLDELKTDLAQISSEIKEETKKEINWESIKTDFTLEKEAPHIERLINLQEYWKSEFYSLFKKYSENYTLYEIGRFLNLPIRFKFPLLIRLFEKIKAFNVEDDDILLLL